MIKIRHNAFETNSSSIHSLIITNENTTPARKVVFEIGEFGWSGEVYDDINNKASYLYTAACEIEKYDVQDEIRELLKPYGIECEFAAPAHFNEKYHYLDNGGIDHYDDLKDFVEEIMNDSNMMIRFLFNPDSFIVTYNDNMDREDHEYYAHITNDIDYSYIEYTKGN